MEDTGCMEVRSREGPDMANSTFLEDHDIAKSTSMGGPDAAKNTSREDLEAAENTFLEDHNIVNGTSTEGPDAAENPLLEDHDIAKSTSVRGPDAANDTSVGGPDAANDTSVGGPDAANDTSMGGPDAANDTSMGGPDAANDTSVGGPDAAKNTSMGGPSDAQGPSLNCPCVSEDTLVECGGNATGGCIKGSGSPEDVPMKNFDTAKATSTDGLGNIGVTTKKGSAGPNGLSMSLPSGTEVDPGVAPAGRDFFGAYPAHLGLVNQGATCYLNSLLQCLFFTPEFRHAILSCEDLEESSLVTQLRKVFVALQTAQGPVTTSAITRCLGLRNVHQQQDVLEFFQTLLTRMAAERAELGQLFQMTTEHVIRCVACGEEMRQEEERRFLMVPVTQVDGGPPCSVAESVQALFREEQVTGDNQYYCEQCDRKTGAVSTLHLQKLPPVLVIVLQRFTFKDGTFWKLEHNVTLSGTLCLPSPDENSYDLFAVCHHFGDLTGGHYMVDTKSLEERCWHRFSDCFVQQLQLEPSETRTAYLLMYRQKHHRHSTLSEGPPNQFSHPEAQHYCPPKCEQDRCESYLTTSNNHNNSNPAPQPDSAPGDSFGGCPGAQNDVRVMDEVSLL